jgi:hypothetical protein
MEPAMIMRQAPQPEINKPARSTATVSLSLSRERLERAIQQERERPGLRQPISVALKDYEATLAKLVTAKFDLRLSISSDPLEQSLFLGGAEVAQHLLDDNDLAVKARAIIAGRQPPAAGLDEGRLNRKLKLIDSLIKIRRALDR